MSPKPKDYRPKVISFPTSLDGLNIATSQSVLWPCHAFSISIPQKKKNALNVFEETILKITEIESGDTEKIALLTCLEKELVAFIQNRLNQLGLLNDRFELSEHGQELLYKWQNKTDGNLEYTVATVFVDLLSGKLLPYVSKKLPYQKIFKIDDKGFIGFATDATNKKSRVWARQIHPAKDSFWKVVPDTNDIIRAIREFKRKYKRYALLNQGIDQHPPQVPMAEAISLHENPELVYLHCDVLIQIGNSDLLVTDGCGFGFSQVFANYLTSQDWQWVIDLRRKGVIESLGPDQGDEGADEESSAVGGLNKYPHIEGPLKNAEGNLSKAENIEVRSSNDEQEFCRLTTEAVVALYEAIEWALRFVISDNPVPDWERFFSSQSSRENGKMLCEFATKIGFDVSGSEKALLEVKPGKIKAFDRGVTEIGPLLALAIAGAINYLNHPLHHLAIEYPRCLSFIKALKKLRDPVNHGKSISVELSLETLEDYRDRTKQLIHSLIPDITGSAYATKTKLERDIDQDRLKARIEMEESLGLGFVQSVSPSLREELIKVTILSQRETLNNDQLRRYINSLYSIMQLSLFEVAKDQRSSIKNGTNLRDEAIKQIVQSGFYPAPDDIPEQIRTVNTERLYQTVQGSSTTLGAHLLAVFLLGSESEQIKLQKLDPRFVEHVSNLIQQRGHGNEQPSDFLRDDIVSLKNNVFKSIKIIKEVF